MSTSSNTDLLKLNPRKIFIKNFPSYLLLKKISEWHGKIQSPRSPLKTLIQKALPKVIFQVESALKEAFNELLRRKHRFVLLANLLRLHFGNMFPWKEIGRRNADEGLKHTLSNIKELSKRGVACLTRDVKIAENFRRNPVNIKKPFSLCPNFFQQKPPKFLELCVGVYHCV